MRPCSPDRRAGDHGSSPPQHDVQRLEARLMTPPVGAAAQRARKGAGKTVVVALGGNAILQPGQLGTFEEQLVNVDAAMRRIAELVEAGWEVVLTHGNGPQVGNLLIQNARPPRPWRPCPWTSAGPRARARSATCSSRRSATTWRGAGSPRRSPRCSRRWRSTPPTRPSPTRQSRSGRSTPPPRPRR